MDYERANPATEHSNKSGRSESIARWAFWVLSFILVVGALCYKYLWQ